MTDSLPTCANTERSWWLVERGAAMNHVPTLWWTGDATIGTYGWSADANDAVRFPTRLAAEEFLREKNIVGLHRYEFGQAVEHGWLPCRMGGTP